MEDSLQTLGNLTFHLKMIKMLFYSLLIKIKYTPIKMIIVQFFVVKVLDQLLVIMKSKILVL